MVAGHSQTAPVTLTSEADATALVELRQKLAADGVAVSYNDLFLAILAKALGEHPRLNAALDGDTVKLWPQMDIAVAVDTDAGCWRRWCAGWIARAWRSSLPKPPLGRARPRRQVRAG